MMAKTPQLRTSLSAGREMVGGITKSELAREAGISLTMLNDALERGCPPGPAAAVRVWRAANVGPAMPRTKSGRTRTKVSVGAARPVGRPPKMIQPPTAEQDAAAVAQLRSAEQANKALEAAQLASMEMNRLRALKMRHEVRKLKIAHRKATIELQLSQRELLPRDLVERTISEMVIEARSQFETLPDQLRPRFPKEVAEELVNEVREAIELSLRRMEAWAPSWADDDDEAADAMEGGGK